jgi:hypothetical protein
MKVGAARLEDRLGANEPPYRSRGEAQVGRLLDRYGIPFFYEHPLIVRDRGRYRVWHPDFLLPTRDDLVVEYAGLPDIPEYMKGLRHKANVYGVNGIPALFVYPHDLAGPEWPTRLVQRIEAYDGARDKEPAAPLAAAQTPHGYL